MTVTLITPCISEALRLCGNVRARLSVASGVAREWPGWLTPCEKCYIQYNMKDHDGDEIACFSVR